MDGRWRAGAADALHAVAGRVRGAPDDGVDRRVEYRLEAGRAAALAADGGIAVGDRGRQPADRRALLAGRAHARAKSIRGASFQRRVDRLDFLSHESLALRWMAHVHPGHGATTVPWSRVLSRH